MITGKKSIVLANIDSTLDPETGDRLKVVKGAKKLVGTVELVGIHTAQLGQAQGFNFAFSVVIGRIQYANEKYMFFDDTLYEIKGMSKARTDTQMLLNVQRLEDASIKAAVERWQNDLL